MKRLLISVICLMFATFLFSQDDTVDVKDDVSQENITKTELEYQV